MLLEGPLDELQLRPVNHPNHCPYDPEQKANWEYIENIL
jgi:hypothetical protein